MIPFEYLYGIKCNTPMTCNNIVDIVVLGTNMINAMEERIVKIKKNLKEARDK